MEKILKQLKAHKKYENWHDTTDPIACEIVRIQNLGFEEAHELRKCGHSVGDYRDPNYGTDKYDGDERCVGCEPKCNCSCHLGKPFIWKGGQPCCYCENNKIYGR